MTPAELVIARLQDRGLKVKRIKAGQWESQCSGHTNRKPSLGIGEGSDGQALLYCQAGCETEAVVRAIDLTMADLFPPNGHKAARDAIVATYDYHACWRVVAVQPRWSSNLCRVAAPLALRRVNRTLIIGQSR